MKPVNTKSGQEPALVIKYYMKKNCSFKTQGHSPQLQQDVLPAPDFS